MGSLATCFLVGACQNFALLGQVVDSTTTWLRQKEFSEYEQFCAIIKSLEENF
jgi:hypothetical protein